MRADLVSIADIDRIWPIISDRIVACMNKINFDCSPGEMWAALRQGNLFLIIVHDGETIAGATVWKAETWVKGPVLKNIITVGDDLKSWFALINEAAITLAKQCGAKTYIWRGSKAWARHFPQARMTCNYSMEVPE